jgi:CheY-like chemotaxis protein
MARILLNTLGAPGRMPSSWCTPTSSTMKDCSFPPMRRLLLAEDDRDLRDVLREVLEATGASVVTVADGKTALDALLGGGSFDLAILDVGMPRMSGLDVLRAAARSGELDRVPVVLITGFGDEELRDEALALGALEVMNKPLDAQDLHELILRSTAGRRR